MRTAARNIRILLTATVLTTGLTVLGGATANAASPDCGRSPSDGRVPSKPGRTYSVRTPDSDALIELYYSPSTACARGRVLGLPGAEIWTDRSWVDNPSSGWEGPNDFKRIQSPSQTAATGWYNDSGRYMRACGTAREFGTIVCTSWF